MRYVIPMFHEQVRLTNNSGRICALIPNYTRVYPESVGYKTTDGALKVYVIEVIAEGPLSQVNIEKDGGEDKHLLWVGSRQGRYQVGDLVTCPIESLIPLK